MLKHGLCPLPLDSTPMQPSISLCITAYNNSFDVIRVLMSVVPQQHKIAQVVVCDDGSSVTHASRIKSCLHSCIDVPFDYVWHQDLGWRLAAIRNKGISRATGEYIIFVDGDCILHPRFIDDYVALRRRGEFVIGQRIHVKNAYRELPFSPKRSERLRFLLRRRFLKSRFAFRNPLERGTLVTDMRNLRSPLPISGIGLGCNHGFWKSDSLAVAGYDEQFTYWGPEDSDFAFRMIATGISARILKSRCLVYHLDHDSNSSYADPGTLRDGYRLMLESFYGKRVVSAVSSLSGC